MDRERSAVDWNKVKHMRAVVERYYLRNRSNDNIDIPRYDLFVTEVREDYERAGFDLTSESDLYKLWGQLSITCSAGNYLLTECTSDEQMRGALKVLGTYGNMTGLFLREATKWVSAVPPVDPATDLECGHDH